MSSPKPIMLGLAPSRAPPPHAQQLSAAAVLHPHRPVIKGLSGLGAAARLVDSAAGHLTVVRGIIPAVPVPRPGGLEVGEHGLPGNRQCLRAWPRAVESSRAHLRRHVLNHGYGRYYITERVPMEDGGHLMTPPPAASPAVEVEQELPGPETAGLGR